MAIRTFQSLVHRRDPGFMWDTIGRTGIVASIFLAPLLLLPWTSDPWEVNKILVLFIGVVVGWIGFFGGAMARKKIAWTAQRLDWIVLTVVIVTALSLIFSVDRWMSWSGMTGAVAGTAWMVLVGSSLYFLTGQFATTDGVQRMWWWALAGGVGVSVFLQVFQLSGFSLLPSVFSGSDFLNTISNNVLDISIIAAALGAGALLYASQVRIKIARLLAIAMAVACLVVLAYVAQPIGWATFAIGMITIVVAESRRGKSMQTKWIITAVTIATIGMILQLSGFARTRPADIRLDARTSQAVTWQTLRHRPVLGSGPATWFHDFVAYRSTKFNSSPWWSNRFVRSQSGWTELFATGGILGAAAWIGLLGYAMMLAWHHWNRNPDGQRMWLVFMVGATGLLGLFSSWSLVWLMGMWVALGLLRAQLGKLQPRPIGMGVPLSLALMVLAAVGIGYVAARDYTADVLVQQANTAMLKGKPIDQIQSPLETAVAIAPRQIPGRSLLSTVYAAQAEQAVQAGDSTHATILVQQAVATMEQGIARNPRQPVAYEEMNNVLNRLSSIVVDADQRARQNFDTLRKLEPANPIHDVGYGQTSMVMRARLLGEASVTDEVKKQAAQLSTAALQSYAAALRKKPDYLQARFARAQAYDALNQNTDALAELETVKPAALNLPVFWVEYGTILSKVNRPAEAVTAFEKSIQLDPTNSNGYVGLAEHYRRQSDVAKAKETVERGLKAIPNDPSLTQVQTELNR